MAATPSAPQLNAFTELNVFVHHTAEGSTENHRLASLGKSALNAAYMSALFQARPDLKGNELQQHFDGTFPSFVSRWVAAYAWHNRMRVVPVDVNRYDAQETLRIFQTYAGAVVNDYGQDVLTEWIRRLVNTP